MIGSSLQQRKHNINLFHELLSVDFGYTVQGLLLLFVTHSRPLSYDSLSLAMSQIHSLQTNGTSSSSSVDPKHS